MTAIVFFQASFEIIRVSDVALMIDYASQHVDYKTCLIWFHNCSRVRSEV